MASGAGGMAWRFQTKSLLSIRLELMAVHAAEVKAQALLHGVGVEVNLVREGNGLSAGPGLGRKGDKRTTAVGARVNFLVAECTEFTRLHSKLHLVTGALCTALVIVAPGSLRLCVAFGGVTMLAGYLRVLLVRKSVGLDGSTLVARSGPLTSTRSRDEEGQTAQQRPKAQKWKARRQGSYGVGPSGGLLAPLRLPNCTMPHFELWRSNRISEAFPPITGRPRFPKTW